jgi:hypothetical protein
MQQNPDWNFPLSFNIIDRKQDFEHLINTFSLYLTAREFWSIEVISML